MMPFGGGSGGVRVGRSRMRLDEMDCADIMMKAVQRKRSRSIARRESFSGTEDDLKKFRDAVEANEKESKDLQKDIDEYAVKVRELRGGKDEKVRTEDNCEEKSLKEVKNADIDENSLNLGEDKTDSTKLITCKEVDNNENKIDIQCENTNTDEKLELLQEERLRIEEETKIKEEKEVQKRAEEEEKKQIEEVQKQKEREDAMQKAQEDEKIRMETELKLRAAEEEKIKAEEAERNRVEEELKIKAEEELRQREQQEERMRIEEEEKFKADEEERLKKEELEKKRIEEEEKLKKAEEERLKKEEAEKLRMEEEAKLQAEEEENLKKEEAEKMRMEEEAKLQAEEEERLKKEEAERIRMEEESQLKEKEEEAVKLQEELRIKAEEEEHLRVKKEERIRLAEESKLKEDAEERFKVEEELRLKEEESKEDKKEPNIDSNNVGDISSDQGTNFLSIVDRIKNDITTLKTITHGPTAANDNSDHIEQTDNKTQQNSSASGVCEKKNDSTIASNYNDNAPAKDVNTNASSDHKQSGLKVALDRVYREKSASHIQIPKELSSHLINLSSANISEQLRRSCSNIVAHTMEQELSKEFLLKKLEELLKQERKQVGEDLRRRKEQLKETRESHMKEMQSLSHKHKIDLKSLEEKYSKKFSNLENHYLDGIEQLKKDIELLENEKENMKNPNQLITNSMTPSSRSCMNSAMGNQNLSDLESELQCCSCQHICRPPCKIYQCPEGDILCENCKPPKVLYCPRCRSSLEGTMSRNKGLEKIAAKYYS